MLRFTGVQLPFVSAKQLVRSVPRLVVIQGTDDDICRFRDPSPVFAASTEAVEVPPTATGRGPMTVCESRSLGAANAAASQASAKVRRTSVFFWHSTPTPELLFSCPKVFDER